MLLEPASGVNEGSSSSRSPSPSRRSQSRSPPSSVMAHPMPHHNPFMHSDPSSQMLAPPPAAPHGPRLPAQYSRTPSPGTPSFDPNPTASSGVNGVDTHSNSNNMRIRDGKSRSSVLYENEEVKAPIRPSEKALGKRRVVESMVFEGKELSMVKGAAD